MPHVFYVVEGHGEEAISIQMAHPNVFAVSTRPGSSTLVLSDIQQSFPFLPLNPSFSLSFSFRSTVNKATQWIYVNQSNPDTPVLATTPGGNQFFLKVHVPTGCEGLVSRNPPPPQRLEQHQHQQQQQQHWEEDQQDQQDQQDRRQRDSFSYDGEQYEEDEDFPRESYPPEDLEAFAMKAALEESRQEQLKQDADKKKDHRGKKKKREKESRRKQRSERRESEQLSQQRKQHEDAALQRATDVVEKQKRRGSSSTSSTSSTSTSTTSSQGQPEGSSSERGQERSRSSSMFGMLKSGLKSGLKTAASAAVAGASAVRSAVRRGVTIDFETRSVMLDSEPFAEGGFCNVYLARDVNNPEEQYALKWMVAQEKSHLKDMMWEIDVHRRLCGNPHIMNLLDHLVRPSEKIDNRSAKDVLLLYPLSRGGSLFDMIETGIKKMDGGSSSNHHPPWPFPQQVALQYFLEACDGVKHMHKNGLAHRDIKPHNILLFTDVDGNKRAVVMDLGSTSQLDVQLKDRRAAMELQDECQSKCSPPYRAPELHEPEPDSIIDGRVDVFSLGATLYAMAYGYNPFEHPNRGFEKLALLNGNAEFPESGMNQYGERYSEAFNHLIKAMIKPNPGKRAKLSKVIKAAKSML